MNFRAFVSIRLILAGTCMALVSAITVYFWQSKSDLASTSSSVEHVSRLFATESINVELGRGNLVNLEDALRRLNDVNPVLYSYVTDTKDRIVVTSSAMPSDLSQRYNWEPDSSVLPQNGGIVAFKPTVDFYFSKKIHGTSDSELILVETPVLEHSSGVRLGTLHTVFSVGQALTSARLNALGLAVVFFVFFLATAVLLSRMFSSRISGPIEQVSFLVKESVQNGNAINSLLNELQKSSYDGGVNEVEALRSGLILLLKTIGIQNVKLQDACVTIELGELASQVAHDIRSPLAALAAAERDLAVLPEDTRLMVRGAVARIRDIANELLTKNKSLAVSQLPGDLDKEVIGPQLLSSLIEGIVTEKRMQYRSRLGVEIEFSFEPACYGLFASIQSKEFKRVLSNLINNAVESIPDTSNGKVEVRLASVSTGVSIYVRDNGQGIPREILGKLTQRGETHGKAGGSGLGLYHARKSCEAWGGALAIESAVGQGTVLTLTLPGCPAPSWFSERLMLKPGMTVVVLDDDPSIHRIWQGRWESLRVQEQGIHLEYFSQPAQLRQWYNQRRAEAGQVLCLLDYELLGFQESGLDLIQELGLSKQSVLVTSRFEENSIRERCSRLGVQLLPKGMAGFVPIELAHPKERPDLVLVDDDPLVHMVWKMTAKKHGHNLRSFKNAADFLAVVDQLDEATPMYIDESLGLGLSGLTIARDLRARGFKRLFLATGYSPEHFGEQSCLEGIVGKEPPANWL